MAAPMKMSQLLSVHFGHNFSLAKTFTVRRHVFICQKCLTLQPQKFLNRMHVVNGRNIRNLDAARNFLPIFGKGDNYCTLRKRSSESGLYSKISNVYFKTSQWSDSCHFSSQYENSDKVSTTGIGKVDKRENILTVPNLLTLSRIIATPIIGYLVVQEIYPLALGIFVVAGFTDLLDGYIARNFKNQMSSFGTALDPLADKILITVLTVTLTMSHLLPVPLAVLIISRDVLLIATGFFIRYVTLPPPRTFKRYFDATNPTARLLPTTLSKMNTGLQLGLVCFTLAAPVFSYVDHTALQCLWYLTAATTFYSGVDYMINHKKCIEYLDSSHYKPK